MSAFLQSRENIRQYQVLSPNRSSQGCQCDLIKADIVENLLPDWTEKDGLRCRWVSQECFKGWRRSQDFCEYRVLQVSTK